MTDTANFQKLVRRRLERGAPCSLNPDEIAAVQALFQERDDWRETADARTQDVALLLHLLADIRTAAGDPNGKMMQPELIAHIREMRAVLQQIRTELRQTRGCIDTRTLGRMQAVIVAAGGGE